MPVGAAPPQGKAPALGVAHPLWVVRHAQPLVDPGVCYGATDMGADVASTSASAQALAARLPHAARLWCSPLRRCVQLAQAVCGLRPDLTLVPDPRLVEMDFGCWEGWRWDAIPKAEIDAWTAQFWRTRFGGRESVSELMARVHAAWGDARQAQAPVAWITHAGVIRAAILLASGVTTLERADQWPARGPGFGECLCL